jgi:hypothetical protein
VPAVAVFDHDGSMYIFSEQSGNRGKVRNISISSPSPEYLRFEFSGTDAIWNFRKYPGKKERKYHEKLPNEKNPELFQIGLIGPDGKTVIPAEKGFSILTEAAELIISVFGKQSGNNIIHIFGYAAGHDIGYPDYTPSAFLGGPEAFKKAIESLHSYGFSASLYMNARLADFDFLNKQPEYITAALRDKNGNIITEFYRNRKFAVMNPLDSLWQNKIIQEARMLAGFGADWIQLDQVAGRAAPVDPGKDFASGYEKIIKEIKTFGIKVWIQGVSTYFSADAFEATWRPLTVLDDGTLRGGFPFGIPDLTLINTLGFTGTLIVPEEKRRFLENQTEKIIHDKNTFRDSLPLCGQKSISGIKKGGEIKKIITPAWGGINGGIQ